MANATLLYTNDWDGSFGDVSEQYRCRSDQFTLVSNWDGRKACKYYQAGNLTCAEYGGEQKHRTQHLQANSGNYGSAYGPGLNFNKKSGGTLIYGPWWFGFGFWYSSSNPASPMANSFHIAFDIKSMSSEFGDPTSYIHSGNVLRVIPRHEISPLYEMTFTKDAWHDVIWYIERRTGSNGVFRMWLDGVLKINWTGSTALDLADSIVSRFRTGIYWGADTHTGGVTMYYSAVRIAIGGSDGYALVDPSTDGTPPPAPSITGSIEATSDSLPATLALTEEGAVDWAHWGLTASTSFNTKATGGDYIGNVTASQTIGRWTPSLLAVSWTDGTPTASSAGTTTEIYIDGAAGDTMYFDVVADTTTRVLRVYAQCTLCVMRITATMPDSTATAQYVEATSSTTTSTGIVAEFTFAASATASLRVTLSVQSTYGTDASIELIAATLALPGTETTGTTTGGVIHRRWGVVNGNRRRKRIHG